MQRRENTTAAEATGLVDDTTITKENKERLTMVRRSNRFCEVLLKGLM